MDIRKRKWIVVMKNKRKYKINCHDLRKAYYLKKIRIPKVPPYESEIL